ncbi:hypothetical protein F4776DRAFT_12923 [Hypoxylon sp. NC0597]|nr:hypothetical protein F4776DRAFT_12923 [Hypoxylon sp. NC0597]
MPSFTDLPPELLQLIAGTCPASDILALCRTCRHLNETCNIPAVFQMSFERHLPDLTSTTFSNRSTLVRFMQRYVDGPTKPCQRNEGPRMTWLCLAMAVSRLQHVLSELQGVASSISFGGNPFHEDKHKLLSGSIGFLATLPIWGYTAVCDFSLVTALEDLYPLVFGVLRWNHLNTDHSVGGESPLQFAFCLVMSSLEVCQSPGVYDLTHKKKNTVFHNDNYVCVKSHYDGTKMGQEYGNFQESWIGKQTFALLLIDLIARNFRCVAGSESSYFTLLRNLRLVTRKDMVPTELPNPRKIEFLGSWYFTDAKGKEEVEHVTWVGATSLRPRFPLLTPHLIGIPGKRGRYLQPFTGDEWWSWYTTRVRDLSRRLDEGEWSGTYIRNLHNLRSRRKLGPPLERIRFRKTSIDSDTYAVEAPEGVDDVGTFTLHGEVKVSDMGCIVHLRKQYASAVHHWRGLLTPLGICGGSYLPGPVHRGAIGYFWLWKREWVGDVDK